ncbi:hypothetical protein MRB53_011975 [Persea americana]|uniref:Uncharacterized protein n=1 Tax=Persea americana TaxID=3435 RepID=A0ACC2LWW9_PERAE|nr:hypothetical protein MRB53_011975 [Persea americana]
MGPVSLWRDAWTNHGVCSGLNETAYFDKALQLRKKINLLSVLECEDIYPSDDFCYSPYNDLSLKSLLLSRIFHADCNLQSAG